MGKKNKGRLKLKSKASNNSAKRKELERKRRAGHKRFLLLLKKQSEKTGIPYFPPVYVMGRFYNSLGKKPSYGNTILFLKDKFELLSPKPIPIFQHGILELPEEFSLSENYAESMFFLKKLFYLLYEEKFPIITLDYDKCLNLDIDASIFMDLILACFINYYKRCIKKHRKVGVDRITPKNFQKDEIAKVLFSIGAPRNLKGFKINYEDILAFDLRVGDNKKSNRATLKEIHETEIVDYVLECLKKMNRSLTPDAETNLSKVVGEIMANAEEHSNFRYRFAIGYFQESKGSNHIGVFKLVIFNFGQTIYESFIRPDCPNPGVVAQMKNISSEYTKRGFIKKAEFEEQTLWTLYALQEGVTSKKDWKRGNGSIRFIDSFFKLKGDVNKDEKSNLLLISGNTRIKFDGTYPLVEQVKGPKKRKYKVMAFNDLGDIHEKPDKNYVNFMPEFFPGTMISAKICINYQNVEDIENGSDNN